MTTLMDVVKSQSLHMIITNSAVKVYTSNRSPKEFEVVASWINTTASFNLRGDGMKSFT